MNRSDADAAATDAVEVELPPAMIERIDVLTDADESVEEWVADAIDQRLVRADATLSECVGVDVEVPEPILTHARLRFEAERERGRDPDFGEIVEDYLSLAPRWTADGEPVRGIDGGDD